MSRVTGYGSLPGLRLGTFFAVVGGRGMRVKLRRPPVE
jgi:hypothetical protein